MKVYQIFNNIGCAFAKDQIVQTNCGACFDSDGTRSSRAKASIVGAGTYIPRDPPDVRGRKFYHCCSTTDMKYTDKTRQKKINKYLV